MAEIFGPVGIGIGLITTLALLVFVAKRWGKADARADRAEAAEQTQKDIRNALNAAPRDPGELANRLRRGGQL